MGLPVVVIGMVKRDGVLINRKALDKIKMDTLLDSMKEGDEVEVTYELPHNLSSNGQKATVHIYIRTLAEETGATPLEIEEQVKKKAGLIRGGELMSFKHCTKDEVSKAIKVCLEIGDMLDINLHTH
jgi:hypothetical protein